MTDTIEELGKQEQQPITDKPHVPLCVNFGGYWLDVPRHSQLGGYVVSCAIEPLVHLGWYEDYPQLVMPRAHNGSDVIVEGSGLGVSAALATLLGQDAKKREIDSGCGWSAAATIEHTGVCAWQSGTGEPVVFCYNDASWLRGLMAVNWTGRSHPPASTIVVKPRDYQRVGNAGHWAMRAIARNSVDMLADAVNMSHEQQVEEGMAKLPKLHRSIAEKFCGAGWGGYALYLFKSQRHRDEAVGEGMMAIEPYFKPKGKQ